MTTRPPVSKSSDVKQTGPKKPEVEGVNPYSGATPKGEQVEAMFDNIASAYDFMNTAMTFGLHRLWLRRALSMLALRPGARVLDMATGTGDVALRIARRYEPHSVTGIDLSARMLAEARRKAAREHPEVGARLEFRQGDALAIDAPDAAFDAATVAYGVRNFEHLEAGLRELARVLRPGGKLCIIELSTPQGLLTGPLYRFYSRRVIPAAGRLVSGDSRAYTYLPESIAACPQRDDMAALLKRAGFADAHWRQLTFGVVTIYIATK